jgi:hypothetical protein
MTVLEPADRAGTPSVDQLVLLAPDEAHGSRTRRGERLDHLFEERCDWVVVAQ